MKKGKEFSQDEYFSSLEKYISRVKPRNGLEIGFAWGMSTIAFFEGDGQNLITIDIDDQFSKVESFKKHLKNKWRFIREDSKTAVPQLKQGFDWIYIDGSHLYPDCLNDLKNCSRLLTTKGIMVCDDYGTYEDVKRAISDFLEENKKFRIKEFIPDAPNKTVVLERRR